MLHGRGATAHDILGLAGNLDVANFRLYAPQATNNSWYPQSFLATPEANEPFLSSALEVLARLVSEIKASGVPEEHIFFCGFSQGACLASEFAGRNATRYGGLVIFTGGLIGDRIYPERYKGDFAGTPVFIGSSDPDFHVPVERVYATTNIFKEMGAEVMEKIYPNMGHTISMDEVERANAHVFPHGNL